MADHDEENWPFGRIHRKLDRILALLNDILQEEEIMAGEMDVLTAAVAAEATVEQSVIALLVGVKAALDNLIATGATPAALTALSATIGANTAVMAAAVVANTPATPAA